MTKAEQKLAAELLNTASDKFGNHGCNDYSLPDTPENRKLVEASNKFNFGEDVELNISKGKIWTTDFSLMGYLADRLEKEL